MKSWVFSAFFVEKMGMHWQKMLKTSPQISQKFHISEFFYGFYCKQKLKTAGVLNKLEIFGKKCETRPEVYSWPQIR